MAVHAQFKVAITDGPKFTEQGRLNVVNLTLAETIKAMAAPAVPGIA